MERASFIFPGNSETIVWRGLKVDGLVGFESGAEEVRDPIAEYANVGTYGLELVMTRLTGYSSATLPS